jgi:hypothetical protein
VLKSYWVGTVHGYRYAGMWPSEQASHGVRYEACEQTKSMTSLVRDATTGAAKAVSVGLVASLAGADPDFSRRSDTLRPNGLLSTTLAPEAS